MQIGNPSFIRSNSGQALLEAALVLPVVLALVLNAINFAYFHLVALNVANAPRSGIEYAVEGFNSTGGTLGLPAVAGATSSGTVANLVFEALHGALPFYNVNTTVHVCSETILVGTPKVGTNGTGTSLRSNCMTCTSETGGGCGAGAAETSGSTAPDPDPEAPNFVLQRVDVTYSFSPLVSGSFFNLALLSTCSGGTCTIHRAVSMRAIN
jgi:hypothetical protein